MRGCVQHHDAATEAEIGEGFRAMTRTAVVFDFPAEAPVLRFLDTRGLGERGYDPSEDLATCENQSHLLIVVMRAVAWKDTIATDRQRQRRSAVAGPAW